MRRLTVIVAGLVIVAAACAPKEEAAAPSAVPSDIDACMPEALNLIEPGVLTIATDSPAYPPWFEKNDPSNGMGYEGAAAYAIAEAMGFAPEDVKWVVEPFNKSYAPGPKDFDFDINQISITPKRAEAVTFSDGYYDVNQALVTLKDGDFASVTAMADLADAKLGAQVGTTSLDYISQYIQPSSDPYIYDTTNDAKSALEAGQIDGIIVDLPTAFYITAVQIPGSEVVGQFPAQGQPEQFGLLFEKDNALVLCANQAIAELKSDGTLEEIQQTWLADKVDAPVLT